MKKLLITLVMGLALSIPSYAETKLADDSFKIAGEEIKVVKFLDEKGVGVRLSNAAGEKICQSDVLGSESRLFKFEDKTFELMLKDLTGDDIPEILAAAFYGPQSSGLFVFSYDSKEKKMVPVKFLNAGSPDLSTDCLVSDIDQKEGSNMVLNSDGSLTALGMVYPEEIGDETLPGHYTWKYAEGMFKLTEKKVLPIDEEEIKPE